MIIWINGAFGSGKTSLSRVLQENIANSIIFDPEDIGTLIQKILPEARSSDFQDFKIWRNLVSHTIIQLQRDYDRVLIVPMTIVVPAYLIEIFTSIEKNDELKHFFLDVEKPVLTRRITMQTICLDKKEDEDIRIWRLGQIDRCVASKSIMPSNTTFLNGQDSTKSLCKSILNSLALLA